MLKGDINLNFRNKFFFYLLIYCKGNASHCQILTWALFVVVA